MDGDWNWRQINFDFVLIILLEDGFVFCIWKKKRERWEQVFRNLGYKLYEGLYIGVTGKTGSSVFLNNDVLDITLNIDKINIGGTWNI